jgi:phosphoserine phosphatase
MTQSMSIELNPASHRIFISHPNLSTQQVEHFSQNCTTFCRLLGDGFQSNRNSTVPTFAANCLSPEIASLRKLGGDMGVDIAIAPPNRSITDFKFAAFDMDSTLITIECIDEIADYVGKKAEVAAITEAAMRGEITDYQESLRRRVALLKGLPVEALQRVYDERLKLTLGAESLIHFLQGAGLKILLVSGGFTFFTERLKTRLRLDYAKSNEFEVRGGVLTGALVGDIIDADAKRDTVLALSEQLGISPQQVIAVGDGANDLKMMSIAGMSVAFHAKPIVQSQASDSINFGGLDTLTGWLNNE